MHMSERMNFIYIYMQYYLILIAYNLETTVISLFKNINSN